MTDEEKTIAIVQALINMGEKAFSIGEIKEFIESQIVAEKLSTERAGELVSIIEEREKRSIEDKEERVSGVISLLLSIGNEEFSDKEIVDFINHLVEKGSLSKLKGDKFIAEIEKRGDPAKLENLRGELQKNNTQ